MVAPGAPDREVVNVDGVIFDDLRPDNWFSQQESKGSYQLTADEGQLYLALPYRFRVVVHSETKPPGAPLLDSASTQPVRDVLKKVDVLREIIDLG